MPVPIRQPAVCALVREGEPLVVEAGEVQDRRASSVATVQISISSQAGGVHT